MHELSLAVDMVDQLEEALKKENATKITKISIILGAMSGVEKVPLEFAIPVAAEGTPLEGAVIEIEEVPLVLKCSDCNQENEAEDIVMICPNCNSMSVEIVKGKEFYIKSMEVQ